MKKTRKIAMICYANGTNRIERRVYEKEDGTEVVKINRSWMELDWYLNDSDFECKVVHDG